MSPFAPHQLIHRVSLGRARGRRTHPVSALAVAAALALTALAGVLVPQAAARGDYLLLPRRELMALPTSGQAWRYVREVAASAWEAPELHDQDNRTNVKALAAALVYARTGDAAMRAKAREALLEMLPTYDLPMDGALGPARQIAGWVLVADFIGLDGAADDAFRGLLRRALTHPIGTHPRWGGSLAACQEDADNNWGAWCSASRIAAALYLRDATVLARSERVFRGFLGDRGAWSHFKGQGTKNGILTAATRSWSCNDAPNVYVPTNPSCGDRSGAFPGDASRSGPYTTLNAMYQSETTAAVVLSTELLYQNGYGRAWSFRGALARIAKFDATHGAWNLGFVQRNWPWLINRRLGTHYPTLPARYGRSLGYTDWLYGSPSGGGTSNPSQTPRPTSTPRAQTNPKPTAPPKQGGSTTRGASSSPVVAQPSASPSGLEPTALPAPTSVATTGPASAAPSDGQSGAGGSTFAGGTSSAIRPLVGGGLLAALSLWAASLFIKLRAHANLAGGGRKRPFS